MTRNSRLFSWILLGLVATFSTLAAKTIHIDSWDGDDKGDGSSVQPVKSIRRAIALAQPGDMIQMKPGNEPIYDSIVIHNKSGTPEQPITFDGGGNTLFGTQPIQIDEWEEVSPGLYRTNKLMADMLAPGDNKRNAPRVNRFFFVINDQMSLMGRSSKGAKAPFRKPAELAAGEWTFVDEEAAFYLAVASGNSLADYQIETPILQNGLSTRGSCNHWRIHNLHVRRFHNDGFNFHGSSRDFKLENISAEECGDDGMSAHGDCHVEVDGFVSRGNSTGICHINDSSSLNRNVVLENNTAINLFLLGTGVHEFRNSKIAAEPGGVRVGPRVEETVELRLFNSQIAWPASPPTKAISTSEGTR